MNTEETRIDVT